MATVSSVHWTSPARERRGPSLGRSATKPRSWYRVVVFTLGFPIVLLGLAELGVRTAEVSGIIASLDARDTARKTLPAGSSWRGKSVNSLGYWDDEFDSSPPPEGRMRIALLGGDATFSGDARTNLATEIERLLPMAEVDHFGVPGGGPRDFAAQLVRDVFPQRPHWVIVCLDTTFEPAGEDRVTDANPWRSLRYAASFFPTNSTQADEARLRLDGAGDYDSHVRRLAPTVESCVKSDDPAHTSARRAARDAIERVAAQCREHNVRCALLLTPGEFQLSPQLTAALCRRQACDPAKLDLTAPQRRWSALASQLDVAAVDLLPRFAASREVLFEPNSSEWNACGRQIAAAAVAKLVAPPR